jgi:CHAT domain-containing protein
VTEAADPAAQRADVLAQMPLHEFVHFSCHGRSNALEPLSSALLLGDGPLTVRDLLRVDLRRTRLVVLAACESGVAGAGMHDEQVGLPAALVEAGVGGVIATSWDIEQAPTFYFLARLYDLLGEDPSRPARAFAAAQDWLRQATWADLKQYPAPSATRTTTGASSLDSIRPYAELATWGAFTYTGV